MARKKTIMDGNMAAAHVAHAVNEVIAIYPITPSSVMGEISDEKSAKGQVNIWGSVPHVVELQSEGGAAGTVHGSLTAGALTTTFTASQGLLLMIPNMYKIAGELTPTVFHVSARALAAQGLSIFGDHSDVMACRACGWAMLASNNPQEVMDMALISQAATLKSRVPFLHFFDGFRTSHELSVVEELTFDDMRHMVDDELVRAHRARSLTPDNPTIKGTSQNPDVYFQGRETVNKYMEDLPAVLQSEMDKFAALTGRQYHLVDYYGASDAKSVIVVMGSACDVVEETIDYLNANGEKFGVVKVHLFQPFPVQAFVDAVPATVENIAVLDRTKEPGAVGEPLYMAVRTAIGEAMVSKTTHFMKYPRVIGGRFGLGSKDFTPAMVKSVFENLNANEPIYSFTTGIEDDVTHKSLPLNKSWLIPSKSYNAMFYGLGSDGTVGANKNTAKIIFTETGKNSQAYFVYDSKKAGSMTTSHVRFGEEQIKSSYLIQQADFIGCHNFSFLERYDLLSPLKKGGVFLLNSQYSKDEVWNKLPALVQKEIREKEAKFYVVDAVKIAQELGLGSRINVILQSAFFAISNIIPKDKALNAIKGAIAKTYGKYGEETVAKNNAAADAGFDKLYEVDYKSLKDGDYASSSLINGCLTDSRASSFVKEVTSVLVAGEGDNIKVSQMPADGTWPTGTARFEKRNIAVKIPVWDPEVCIQCGICSFVCPHSAIRMKYYEKDALKNAPASFKHTDAKGKEFAGYAATIQVAPEDCTGCHACVIDCPAINKANPEKKAINMEDQIPLREQEVENFAFFETLPELSIDKYNKNTIKGSQLAPHMFEFSGACAGCGETPYIKLLTQLFGDRLLMANATGCSSIYGGNLPTTPYCARADGKGPAWSNSLFEDNAEFGYGMRLAVDYFQGKAVSFLESNKGSLDASLVDEILANKNTHDQLEVEKQRERVEKIKSLVKNSSLEAKDDFVNIADYLTPKSVWILGGDGWAYDIGYGGLDHVLASGENINVLVLDTEVYSNTGGQASKSTPLGATAKFATSGKVREKKDLAMISMTYGSIYVAKVSLSNPAQCIKAFLEAERYNGPSIIIAYSHCIAQGIDMMKGSQEQKKAINAGYWTLMRFNPDLMEEGKSPLIIDSKEPGGDLAEFMAGENRFRLTKKTDAAKYEQLVSLAGEKLARRNRFMRIMAEHLVENKQS